MSDQQRQGQDKDASGFKVTDKRIFDAQGELRRQPEPEPEVARSEEQSRPGRPSAGQAEQPPPTGETGKSGPDISSFFFSLYTTAMVHLGEIPDPVAKQRAENLEAAKQMIDILGMLKEKTAGNLKTEEARLIENLLYELRMLFLTKSKALKL